MANDETPIWRAARQTQVLAHRIEDFLHQNSLTNCYTRHINKQLQFRCLQDNHNIINWVLRQKDLHALPLLA